MPPLEFNAATVEDLPRIVEMKLAMFSESGHADLLAPDAGELILSDYRRLYATAEAQHFVARSGGIVIACAGAFLKSDLPFRYFNSPSYGFVGDVYTEPAFRGQGCANLLSERVLLWFGSRGIRMVRLLASEAGRPLYAKLGFVPSDEMVLVNAT